MCQLAGKCQRACALIRIVCERASSYHLGLSCAPRHHRLLLISAHGMTENCLYMPAVFVLAKLMERGPDGEGEREREGESKNARAHAREREGGGGRGGGRPSRSIAGALMHKSPPAAASPDALPPGRATLELDQRRTRQLSECNGGVSVSATEVSR